MTTNYKDFNINYFNVSGELKQAAKGSTAFLTYGSNNTTNSPLFLQLAWIELNTYGIPRLNDFFTEDSQRCFVKTPLCDDVPEVADCKKVLKSIDNKFGSEEFRIKLFGAAKATKFKAYQDVVRKPLTDDDNKNKSTVDYMKIKISTNYDTGEINTSVCTSVMENNKRVRTNVPDESIKTVDDIAKYICYGARVRFIIRPVKLWAQAPNASKDPMYGITFKLVKAEVELPLRMNTYKNLLNTDMFLDSDEETAVQTVATASVITPASAPVSINNKPSSSKNKSTVAVVASESSEGESESESDTEQQVASVKTINRAKSGAVELTDEESDDEDIKPVAKTPPKAPAKSKGKKANA
jgi:hypothetical protein